MSQGFAAWLALAGVTGLVWLSRLFLLDRTLRTRKVLHGASHEPVPTVFPRVSVMVAARDEEPNIRACVESILAQDYPNLEVIVVDDRSSDLTAIILNDLRARYPDRLRVYSVREVPVGWFGKSNAMRLAVENARGDWLLFTDADCRQLSRRTISLAVREGAEKCADLLSITPVLEMKAIWERLIQPACALILMIWFLPNRVNDPGKSTAYANGAFMLFRRACYLAIGGHAAVRDRLNEDIELAQRAKRMGFRLHVVENQDLYCTRMYGTITEAWHGWTRIFKGCLGTLGKLVLTALMVVVLSLIPWLSWVAALMGWMLRADGSTLPTPADHDQWSCAVLAWGGVVLIQQVVLWRVYPCLSAKSVWSVVYVLGALATLAVLVHAMLQAVGATETTWRGTRYRGTQCVDVHAPENRSTGFPPIRTDAAADRS